MLLRQERGRIEFRNVWLLKTMKTGCSLICPSWLSMGERVALIGNTDAGKTMRPAVALPVVTF